MQLGEYQTFEPEICTHSREHHITHENRNSVNKLRATSGVAGFYLYRVNLGRLHLFLVHGQEHEILHIRERFQGSSHGKESEFILQRWGFVELILDSLFFWPRRLSEWKLRKADRTAKETPTPTARDDLIDDTGRVFPMKSAIVVELCGRLGKTATHNTCFLRSVRGCGVSTRKVYGVIHGSLV